MSTNKASLVSNVKVLCQKFAKFHYDKYIDDNDLVKIDNEEIEKIVDKVLTLEKQKELKQYVRASLKAMYGANYNSFSVENIFTEMFDDRDIMIKRVSLEIRKAQK